MFKSAHSVNGPQGPLFEKVAHRRIGVSQIALTSSQNYGTNAQEINRPV
jgi:hypothetical protein